MTPDINKILAKPFYKACNQYGASMGRRNYIGEPAKLYLQRVRLVDGGYDAGGAYWGGGSPLYCAFSEDCETMIFHRWDTYLDEHSRVGVMRGILDTIADRTGDLYGWEFHGVSKVKNRLEYLRHQLAAERVSYDELHELQDYGARGLIDAGDLELLEAAGVPEPR